MVVIFSQSYSSLLHRDGVINRRHSYLNSLNLHAVVMPLSLLLHSFCLLFINDATTFLLSWFWNKDPG